ncbi:Uma2 family endonuclease [Kovacikia minuta CCNUW1]|uniref:Uma2 family endonuclease n=1 Tax=Kovacikia minuta TaxID=2931930 RepID=UPI001CC97875|nr:Uma2 family endonuclease [Kovacikia minuta]UBF26612.1 Uma2 family endonuclease [Kovacikia minuta CCNUW1]
MVYPVNAMMQSELDQQADLDLMTFEEFLEWHPDDGRIFELIRGVPQEVNPTGPHEKLSGFLTIELGISIRQQQLPYFIPKTATLKPYRDKSGYKPDMVILDERALVNEPRWEKQSTILNGASAPLVIEITSTNWRDDYGVKLSDYELLGVPEYWIVDYLGLAASRLIGSPKQPTVSIYNLVDGEYQVNQFRSSERIISTVLPELNLLAEQLFKL